MKILYICSKYDYGNPERGLSFAHYNFYNSLINMNHQIIYFPFDEIMLQNGWEAMNRTLLKRVSQEKPDLCFFCISANKIKKETVREISQNVRTVNWFTDDQWKFENFSKYWAPCFSFVTTTDSKSVEKYHRIGYENVIKTQWACNQFLYKPLNLEKIYDVTFIGQSYGKRGEMIKKIRESGIKVNCWGRGWPSNRISQEEMIRIFSQSKINLNFSESSTRTPLKAILGIFLRPHRIGNLKSFIDRRKRKQIKGRNFEVPGCGGFLLTSSADNIGDYYQDGKEIVIFENIEDVIKKIKYYLEHEEEREKIALAGYQRTIKEHTYEQRFKEIFKAIGFHNSIDA